MGLGSAWAQPGRAAGLPDLIDRLQPSVRPVGTWKPTDSPRFGFRGTGFAVGDGSLVATNLHVLPSALEATAEPQLAVLVGADSGAGQVRMARLVASDPASDLALLKIDGPALPALGLAGDAAARAGTAIALLGYPIGGALGFTLVTHRGIISAVTLLALPAPNASELDPRTASRLRQGNFSVYQLDATAYPGNSGGPLVDIDTGAVLGIVNMVLVKGSHESALAQPTGISYAIPISHLRELLGGWASAPQTR
jgi:S1-C subfamily serine protease